MGDRINFWNSLIAILAPRAAHAEVIVSSSNVEPLICPSFEEEPWQSRAAAVKTKDEYVEVDWSSTTVTPPPLPLNHGMVKLYREFLETVPDACWIDEENDVD